MLILPIGSGLHFQDDCQFDGRTEWKARDTKDKARRDRLLAEDISKQLRRRIGDLRVLSKLRHRGDIHAEPHDVAHAVRDTMRRTLLWSQRFARFGSTPRLLIACFPNME
jgi:hypothetical protein